MRMGYRGAPPVAAARAVAGSAALALGAPAQDGCAHELGYQRQALAGVREQVGVGPRELGSQGAPDDAPERVDGVGRGLGGAHAGELAGAGHQRLEHATGLDPPQVRLVVDRAHHRIADPRAIARDVAGHDRRRLLERRVLDQREQPALGELLAPQQQLFDSFGDDRPWSSTRLAHPAPSSLFYHLSTSCIPINVNRSLLFARMRRCLPR